MDRREKLAQVIDPEVWALVKDERFDREPKARELLVSVSLATADRIIESGLMASEEWDRAEYTRARNIIIENTSRKGYCYDVTDLLDGYVMHDPRCPRWPDSAVSGSYCIKEGHR